MPAPIPPSLVRIGGLIGDSGIARLQQTHVLVVGLGAVGGAAVEALARSGIGMLTLVDGDAFEISNLNRQPFASQQTLHQPKAPATASELQALAPTCKTRPITLRISPENIEALLSEIKPDIVLDAIDDIPSKIALLTACVKQNIGVWSAMGAARKRHPQDLRVTDLSKTEVCPLARAIRQGLRKLGIHKGIRCVWSKEPPAPHLPGTLGSFMPVTATAGLLLAADLINTRLKD